MSARGPRRGRLPRRSVLRLSGVGLVLVAGSACARIPTSSGIDERELGPGNGADAPYVRALPPADGADPTAVVRGFVQAGVGPESDYAVARQYLTREASAAWEPTAGVTIYAGAQELEARQSAEGTVVLGVQATASVDATGVRSDLTVPASRELTLELTQVEGQWRLSAPPDGIFLSEAAFETLFAAGQLYFIDARTRHLVPDHRWFALQDGAAGVLARLDAGPSPVFEGAVRSEVPGGAGVGDAEVGTGPDGTVQVTVPEAVGSLPPDRRALALAQLETTLRSVRTLSDIRLVWDGADLTPSDEARLERPLPGHRPIAAGRTGVVALSDVAAGTGSGSLVPALEGIAVRAPAIAQDGVLAAALSEDEGTVLIAATDDSVPLREVSARDRFVGPRVDDAGYVWTADRATPGQLRALSGSDPAGDLVVPGAWLGGREVLALDISADATRLLVLSSDNQESRLDLCAILRESDGHPVGLTDPRAVRTAQLTDVGQASWFDEVGVIVLGTDTVTEEPRAQVVDFATGREPLPIVVERVDRIAGTSVGESLWAGTPSGALLRSDGETWEVTDIEARDPGFY